MKNFYYAAYETKSGKELCIGVWDSIPELIEAMKITKKAAYCSLYRNKKGVNRHIARFALHRFGKRKQKKTS